MQYYDGCKSNIRRASYYVTPQSWGKKVELLEDNRIHRGFHFREAGHPGYLLSAAPPVDLGLAALWLQLRRPINKNTQKPFSLRINKATPLDWQNCCYLLKNARLAFATAARPYLKCCLFTYSCSDCCAQWSSA